jgi:hypothetical protein
MREKLYYGQPQFLWDDLCARAEELLHEYQLGTHLVAAYPAGNRIYGLESYPPGIFCLYVDSVEALINPLSNYHQQLGFKTFHVGTGHSPIIMADIFKWVQWLHTREHDKRAKELLHIIPFGQHVIHEDPSISEIIKACYQGMKEVNFQIYNKENMSPKDTFLYHRAMNILQYTGKFFPNINPEWDQVVDGAVLKALLYKDKLYNLDKEIREIILENNQSKDLYDNPWPRPPLGPIIKESFGLDSHEAISKAVMDFYRFQL